MLPSGLRPLCPPTLLLPPLLPPRTTPAARDSQGERINTRPQARGGRPCSPQVCYFLYLSFCGTAVGSAGAAAAAASILPSLSPQQGLS